MLTAYVSGKKSMAGWGLADQDNSQSGILRDLMGAIPAYSIALLPNKKLFRGTDIPTYFMNHIQRAVENGNTDNIAHQLMHGIGDKKKICSTATHQDVITSFAARKYAISAENKSIHIILTPDTDNPGRGVTMEKNFNYDDPRYKDFNEHEVLMDATNQYKITSLQRNDAYITGNHTTYPEYFIHVSVSNTRTAPYDERDSKGKPARPQIPLTFKTYIHPAFKTLSGETPKNTKIHDKPKRALENIADANRAYTRTDDFCYYPNTSNPHPSSLKNIDAQEKIFLQQVKNAIDDMNNNSKSELESLKSERPSGWKFMAKFKKGYGDYKEKKEPLKRYIKNIEELEKHYNHFQTHTAPTTLTPGGMQYFLEKSVENQEISTYKIPKIKRVLEGLQGVSKNAETRSQAMIEFAGVATAINQNPDHKYLNVETAKNYRAVIINADKEQRKLTFSNNTSEHNRFAVFQNIKNHHTTELPTANSLVQAKNWHDIATKSRQDAVEELGKLDHYVQNNQPDFLLNISTALSYRNTLINAEKEEKRIIFTEGVDARGKEFLNNNNTEYLPKFINLVAIRNHIIAEQERQRQIQLQMQQMLQQQAAQQQQQAAQQQQQAVQRQQQAAQQANAQQAFMMNTQFNAQMAQTNAQINAQQAQFNAQMQSMFGSTSRPPMNNLNMGVPDITGGLNGLNMGVSDMTGWYNNPNM